MKFRIMQGANIFDGSPIFRVYEVDASGAQRYRTGTTNLKEARDFVQRQLNPPEETLVEEIEV